MGAMPPIPTEDPSGMQPDPMTGGEPIPMEGDPTGGEGGQEMGGTNPYDTNFDAGVDADEETDPKRYIQQLTGKLSQSLRTYNEQQPQPDTDLNKYVAGMISKQAAEGLTKADIDEIIAKLNSPGETPDNNGGEPEAPSDPMGGDPSQGQMPTESVDRGGRKSQISELFQEFIKSDGNDGGSIGGELNNGGKNRTYRNKPFSAPQFN